MTIGCACATQSMCVRECKPCQSFQRCVAFILVTFWRRCYETRIILFYLNTKTQKGEAVQADVGERECDMKLQCKCHTYWWRIRRNCGRQTMALPLNGVFRDDDDDDVGGVCFQLIEYISCGSFRMKYIQNRPWIAQLISTVSLMPMNGNARHATAEAQTPDDW